MSKIQEALRMVHAAYPEVTQVIYTAFGEWLYTDKSGNSPSFCDSNGALNPAIDMDLILAASEESEPGSTHHLEELE